MTILAWRRKADPHTDDFVFSFDPKKDITTFELATLLQLAAAGVPMERAFRVRPIDLRDLSEKAGTASPSRMVGAGARVLADPPLLPRTKTRGLRPPIPSPRPSDTKP